jgi:nicotinamide riboside transporter PnuC
MATIKLPTIRYASIYQLVVLVDMVAIIALWIAGKHKFTIKYTP